ncbi:uncharacterized protein LOC133369371 [Rhineura floridana]|uniref:uncharacterized protein LOC133369371 n=1 Tax=Rhineura floridana TaxID=261503 RepID=UPI002AC851F6|nr:uncharacterized protein LOC133369371 [Rhineura floridana]
MKQCQLPTATSAEQQVPWFGFEKACTFVSQSGKNVVVQCNYCLPRIKNLRSAVSSSSNVKKHFERAHPEKLRAIEEAIKARRHGLPEPMHDTPPPKMLKQQQTTLERWGSGREPVTQSNLDRRIIDFIVEETLPLQTVDKPSFINLVRIGLPKDLTIICAKTLRDRIEKSACHNAKQCEGYDNPYMSVDTTSLIIPSTGNHKQRGVLRQKSFTARVIE